MSNAHSYLDAIHEQVLEQFKEILEEEPLPIDDDESDEPIYSHRFTAFSSELQVHTMPHNEQAACVNINVRIGRVYSGYRRALRWLAHNRAWNTVALGSTIHSWQDRELWVYCNRITLPQDRDGIRQLVEDVLTEIQRIELGLKRWCPQLVPGANIAAVFDGGEAEELNRMILTDPSQYLSWVLSHPEEAMEGHGLMNAVIFGWLCRWQDSLDWLDRCNEKIPDYDKSPLWQKNYWHIRCLALRQTKRYPEMLAAADALQALAEPDDDAAVPMIVRSCALAGMERYQELLRRVQSSFYDSEPAIWFWRMVAQAHLGNAEQSFHSYEQYESAVGPDLFALQFLARQLADQTPADLDPSAE